MPEAQCIQAANAVLGESPVWDATTGVLYWVDTKRAAIYRHEPDRGQTGQWLMPHQVGSIGLAGRQRLVFADAVGLGLFDLSTASITRIVNPECGRAQNQLNDGKVDRAGRFWVGSMNLAANGATGALYRTDADHAVQRMDSGFICSNGMGWSPDDRTMYFTDSMARTIWAYNFDLASGRLGERRPFATMPDGEGLPDGLTVDREGFVWSAIWDGWCVLRFAPDGSVVSKIELAVQRPTSCVFGGPDLTTLYITSATDELSSAELARGPLAGALFSACVDVPGLAEPTFAG